MKEKDMKWVYALLLLIFLTGAFLRIQPAAMYDKPLKYDGYWHNRIAQMIKDAGTVPLYEPWPYGGRPHIYPPVYHVMLAGASVLSGMSVFDVVRFFLPVFSALTIPAVFWLVRKFRNEKTALLASFLVALNPYLIHGSYDSPQVISLFLFCFTAYFFLKKKMWHTSLLLGACYALNSFSALVFSAPLAISLLYDRRYSDLPKLAVFPVLFAAVWYIPRAVFLYCSDNSIGPHFIGLGIRYWMDQGALVAVAAVIILFSLYDKTKDAFRRFWLIWVLSFLALYLSYLFTNVTHPWRQDYYLSFGFAILAADVLLNSGKRRSVFLLFFITIFTLGTISAIPSLKPVFAASDYSMMGWIDKNLPNDSVILANHDMCANIMTFTNKSCLLDISFECIENRSQWYSFENYFWTSKPAEAKKTLDSNIISHVIYSSGDRYGATTEEFMTDRIYASWSCEGTCTRDTAVYVIPRNASGQTSYKSEPVPPIGKSFEVRIDDVWPLENNSLQVEGYSYERFARTTDQLEEHGYKGLLAVTPYFFDPSCNCTRDIASDEEIAAAVRNLRNQGWKIALHGYSHNCFNLGRCEFYNLTVNEDRTMLRQGKQHLEALFGVNVTVFVSPKSQVNDNLLAALKQEGLTMDDRGYYEPVYWFEDGSYVWKGFDAFGDEKLLLLHYNTMTQEHAQELGLFLSRNK
jgi:hypothetical protein